MNAIIIIIITIIIIIDSVLQCINIILKSLYDIIYHLSIKVFLTAKVILFYLSLFLRFPAYMCLHFVLSSISTTSMPLLYDLCSIFWYIGCKKKVRHKLQDKFLTLIRRNYVIWIWVRKCFISMLKSIFSDSS